MLHGGAGRADIIGLLSSPWFGRRWIVQEISIAPRASMMLAGYEVSWDDFSRFVCLVHDYYEVTYDRPTSDLDMSVQTHTFAFYHSTAHRLVELVSKLRAPGDPTRFLATHLLEDVLCLCSRFRCQRLGGMTRSTPSCHSAATCLVGDRPEATRMVFPPSPTSRSTTRRQCSKSTRTLYSSPSAAPVAAPT